MLIGPGPGTERAGALVRAFVERFGREPVRWAHAPGRVNLIGEHIDYHGGLVLPLALALDTWVAFRVRGDDTVHVRAHGRTEDATFAIEAPPTYPPGDWRRYVVGIVAELRRAGAAFTGIDAAIHGTVPEGSGLSSSASLLVALGVALLDTTTPTGDRTAAAPSIDGERLIRAARAAEHRHVGVNAGVMDFAAAVHGGRGGPLLLDCATGKTRRVPGAPAGTTWLVTGSGVKHALASSAYNERVAECDRALEMLRRGGLDERTALVDVDLSSLDLPSCDSSASDKDAARSPDTLLRRVRHVVTENRRVAATVAALEAGDPAAVGALMNASHRSLRDDYAVSCEEIETLVRSASAVDGVYGTRITGGGFGGATVSLLDAGAVDSFRDVVMHDYRAAHDRTPTFIPVEPGEAAAAAAWPPPENGV